MVYLCTVHFATSEYLIQASGDCSEPCGDIRATIYTVLVYAMVRDNVAVLCPLHWQLRRRRDARSNAIVLLISSRFSTVRLVNCDQDLNSSGTPRCSTRITVHWITHIPFHDPPFTAESFFP
jgi:hypothetical protein